MDLRNEGKSISRDLLPEGHQNNIFGMGIDYLGSAFRLPGRLLLAEDEAMKGIIFHMELDRLATMARMEKVAPAKGFEDLAADADMFASFS